MSDKMLYSPRGGSSGDLTRDDVTGCCGNDVTQPGSLTTVGMATGAEALTAGAGEIGLGVSKNEGMLMTGRRSGLTVGLLGSLLYAIVTLGGGADLT